MAYTEHRKTGATEEQKRMLRSFSNCLQSLTTASINNSSHPIYVVSGQPIYVTCDEMTAPLREALKKSFASPTHRIQTIYLSNDKKIVIHVAPL
jgi:hypothetical protein